ncbi:hypothetical protein VA7868_02314 [Vibrio aerogenes CECT 7868]|uniref:Uncharacterized protein n=1 Tax=Vibrio aerogenes CECT 7868 TaxID=1216006 RepID=A0A1M5Z590_9VIBR|nr:hypothetical protein [Vibrio aerogenes]SHI19437.1 hypothetical protein VA7868_02314 [Vibrio aerogenes CECT 7868]
MFDFQAALDERLAILKKKKIKSCQGERLHDCSKESIRKSLIDAGILDKHGQMIQRVQP